MILAGDVGGTKVHLALYNFEAGKLKPVRDEPPASFDATAVRNEKLKVLLSKL